MFAQQNIVKELLPNNGWELVETQRPNDDWIIEVWLIKSIWTPTDCYVFITFNVDPQWEERSRKIDGFWDMSLTLNQPDYWNVNNFDIGIRDDEIFSVFLRAHFEKRISEVIDSLNELRLRFKDLK